MEMGKYLPKMYYILCLILQLKRCCDITGVEISSQQIRFLIKRFDLDGDKRWNYLDFVRALTPLSSLEY